MKTRLLCLCMLFCGCASPGPLKDPAISGSIVWEDEGGPKPYASWSPEQQRDLSRALAAAEAGQPAGLSAPPVPLPIPKDTDSSDVSFKGEDAWGMFLAHVAHSLWLERHKKVAWSLLSMTPEQRALLLDSRKLMRREKDGSFTFARTLMHHAASWDPSIAYRFLVENTMLLKSPAKTVIALTGWANHNLRHAMADDDFSARYGWQGPPLVDRILYPKSPGPRRVMGCWGVTGFYAGVLRGANIPVVSDEFDHHSRPVLPTAGLGLHHGDDIYNATVGPSGNVVPPERILLTDEQMRTLVEEPKLDCEGLRCNTKAEQAEFNMTRRQWLLAREFMTDYPMYQYAADGPDYLDGSLQGNRSDNEIKRFVRPFFSAEERRAFMAEIEAELKRVGGGDIEEGERIVRERALAFYR